MQKLLPVTLLMLALLTPDLIAKKKQSAGVVLDGDSSNKSAVLKPHYPEQKKLIDDKKKKKKPSKSELQTLVTSLEKENSRLRNEVRQLQDQLADEELHRERERYDSIRHNRHLHAEIKNLRKNKTIIEEDEDDCPPLR